MQLLSEANSRVEAASASDCAQALLDSMPAVMWFLRSHMRRHRGHGLSVPQFRTLALLDRFPQASLSAVAENLGASAPTASRMVAGLVAKGLITRESCSKDRRQISLMLTSKGQAVLNAARQETQERLADEIAVLGGQERGMIAQSMRLLHEIFGAKPAPGETLDDETL
jgi:DNA-binding MarR family transcriptional regulator